MRLLVAGRMVACMTTMLTAAKSFGSHTYIQILVWRLSASGDRVGGLGPDYDRGYFE